MHRASQARSGICMQSSFAVACLVPRKPWRGRDTGCAGYNPAQTWVPTCVGCLPAHSTAPSHVAVLPAPRPHTGCPCCLPGAPACLHAPTLHSRHRHRHMIHNLHQAAHDRARQVVNASDAVPLIKALAAPHLNHAADSLLPTYQAGHQRLPLPDGSGPRPTTTSLWQDRVGGIARLRT